MRLVKKIKVPKWATLKGIVVTPGLKGVNWSTAWVHLCEVRQALQQFQFQGLKSMLKKNPLLYRIVLQETLSELIENASHGLCFCVLLIKAVANHLGMDIERRNKLSVQRVTKAQVMYLVVELARLGFSPKADLFGIPEWITLFNGVVLFTAFCRQQKVYKQSQARRIRKLLPSSEKIRNVLIEHGITYRTKVKGKWKAYSRAQLMRKAIGKRIAIGPVVTL